MKIAVYIFIGSILIIIIALFVMGKKTHNGTAIGLVDGMLAPCSGKPNCVNSEVGTPDKFKTAPLSVSRLASVEAAVLSLGGEITRSQEGYMSAEFTSGIFKFVDDVETRLDGDRVQIRSASRIGYSDRGVNKARVAAIRAALNQE